MFANAAVCAPQVSALSNDAVRSVESICRTRGQNASLLLQFQSQHGLDICVFELCDCWVESLQEMYNDFEPKRAAQGLPPVGLERIASWISQLRHNGYNLIAMNQGRVIGHAMLCPAGPARAEFAIFIHQDFRNQGIGTRFTRVTLDCARKSGLSSVWLSVEVANLAAIRVYRKVGFLTSEVYGPEQEMAIDLQSKESL